MSADPQSSERFEVVIAGGGVAGVEAALALRDLADEQIGLRLLAPTQEFVYRPLTVREPFAFAEAKRYPLRRIADDLRAELVEDGLAGVDPDRRVVKTQSGTELGYDALLLGLGARIQPRYEHATTIDDRHMDELLRGMIQDVEGGYTRRLGFVIPARMAWPLPTYELALMTAARAYDAGVEVSITILTPEDAPLAIFGTGASEGVARLLADRGIDVVTSAYCEVPASRQVHVSPGDRRFEFDRVIALPELEGPAIENLPQAAEGFIPVDERCQVRGVERVFAAGDAVDFALKYGGTAAQQADTAASAIAALAGASTELIPFEPEIRGVLLTGRKPYYLHAHITGGHGFSSELSEDPSWDAPAKISARYLGPYLDQLDRA